VGYLFSTHQTFVEVSDGQKYGYFVTPLRNSIFVSVIRVKIHLKKEQLATIKKQFNIKLLVDFRLLITVVCVNTNVYCITSVTSRASVECLFSIGKDIFRANRDQTLIN
jgi:hypothetical protein